MGGGVRAAGRRRRDGSVICGANEGVRRLRERGARGAARERPMRRRRGQIWGKSIGQVFKRSM
uniref:Uncharacterized protein n=1 Tax=Oryza sativa subsp. japonica TaxID=39947 RepID=Q6ZFH1_ORYSJ|nr:hypothetical protein [Oryza sativa Japonica Group]